VCRLRHGGLAVDLFRKWKKHLGEIRVDGRERFFMGNQVLGLPRALPMCLRCET
jgi:hypothetical protein